MGLFENIFSKKETTSNVQKANSTFEALTVYKPSFRTFNGSLYESELVRSAIDARARHISKLKIEILGSAQPKLQTMIKHRPNDFQTWSQFLYRLSTILDMENTAVICPIYNDYDELTGYFPILPSNCEIREFNGTPYLRYQFANGDVGAIEWSRCGVLTKFQYKSDFFGTDNRVLLPTMQLVNLQNQGIEEAIKNSATFRFMAKAKNWTDPEDLANEQKMFSSTNFSKESGGILLLPNTYEDVKQIDSKPFTIDNDEMEYIRTNVFNYFGVNTDVLQNKAFGDSWSAFYEGAIEPFCIQFSECITQMTFTPMERSFGAQIVATSNRLQYMSTQDKLNVSAMLCDRGILNRDEVREIWNLPPLPNGEGQEYVIRGEYKNTDDVTDTTTVE